MGSSRLLFALSLLPCLVFAFVVSYPCGVREFRCSNGVCIDEEAKCDGRWDCPGGDDERGCMQFAQDFTGRPSCRHGTFQCADYSSCIPHKWKCDGETDCDDASDEANCGMTGEEMEVLEENSTTPVPSVFEPEVGGHSQENENSTSPLPSGEGASEEKDTSTTILPAVHEEEEKDECFLGGLRCSQYCAQKEDGYVCSCVPGYDLAADGHTCYRKKNPANSDGMGSIQFSSPQQLTVFVDNFNRGKQNDFLVEEERKFSAMDLMTLFSLHTNIPSTEISTDFVSSLSSSLAQHLHKPERYVIVQVVGDQKLSFGGNEKNPAGIVSLKSPSLEDSEQNEVLVEMIGNLLEKNLGIKKNRLFIELIDCTEGRHGDSTV